MMRAMDSVRKYRIPRKAYKTTIVRTEISAVNKMIYSICFLEKPCL